MCPFLSRFKRNMLDDLCMLFGALHGKGVISPKTKDDLLIWLGFLLDKDVWLPILLEPCGPPIAHKTFISDAAGLSIDGVFSFRPGVASVGFSESGKILMAFRLPRPKKMIMTECDSKGQIHLSRNGGLVASFSVGSGFSPESACGLNRGQYCLCLWLG